MGHKGKNSFSSWFVYTLENAQMNCFYHSVRLCANLLLHVQFFAKCPVFQTIIQGMQRPCSYKFYIVTSLITIHKTEQRRQRHYQVCYSTTQRLVCAVLKGLVPLGHVRWVMLPTIYSSTGLTVCLSHQREETKKNNKIITDKVVNSKVWPFFKDQYTCYGLMVRSSNLIFDFCRQGKEIPLQVCNITTTNRVCT